MQRLDFGRDRRLRFLAGKSYNTSDPGLVVNEFQSYLFQQERAAVPAFQAVTLQRVREAYPALAPIVQRVGEERPDSFLASFDALDRALAAAGGPPGGRVLGVRREGARARGPARRPDLLQRELRAAGARRSLATGPRPAVGWPARRSRTGGRLTL